ncbi:hypothetical protein [Teichococcus aestuarii]|uniref:hypothetical protein n=1 Tax=Teichococcus aestuarii TaxID=568898 RepID=UPI00360FD1D0
MPFTHKPANPDRELESKLRAEWPGILRGIIEGCLAWQKHGLEQPKVVEATAEYFSDQDAVRQWLDECCEVSNCPPHYVDTTAGLRPGTRRGSRQRQTIQPDSSAPEFTPVKDSDGIRGRGFQGLRVKVEVQRHWQERDE